MCVNVAICKLDDAAEQDSFVVVVRDVTDRRLLEERLKSAERLEAIGRLAGGVAHDFNNLLTVINGYASLLATNNPTSGEFGSSIAAIRDAGERAARLTAQLLAYGRRTIIEPRAVDINSLLTHSEELLRRLVREDVSLSLVTDNHLRAVQVDPAQLEQVILNLVVNARDAMPNGGRITLQTHSTFLNETKATDSGDMNPGWFAELVVRDSGSGMSAATISHIFEPFFTTKPPSVGTGLGLSTVYGIVKQAGGFINVQSEVGQGTEFRISFPAIADTARGLNESHVNEAVGKGKETVLLVEDESLVLKLAQIVLETHGYKVIACESGMAALKAANSHDGTIHLLVTDMVMPGMSGQELAEKLLLSRPSISVIFMSGYIEDDKLRQSFDGTTFEFVQKPFTPLALARRVRSVLDS